MVKFFKSIIIELKNNIREILKIESIIYDL